MYNHNIATQEMADYCADMMELTGEIYSMTDEEMEKMAREFGEG